MSLRAVWKQTIQHTSESNATLKNIRSHVRANLKHNVLLTFMVSIIFNHNHTQKPTFWKLNTKSLMCNFSFYISTFMFHCSCKVSLLELIKQSPHFITSITNMSKFLVLVDHTLIQKHLLYTKSFILVKFFCLKWEINAKLFKEVYSWNFQIRSFLSDIQSHWDYVTP